MFYTYQIHESARLGWTLKKKLILMLTGSVFTEYLIDFILVVMVCGF